MYVPPPEGQSPVIVQENVINIEPNVDEATGDDVRLRKSQRTRRPAVSDDYVVYLQEHEFNVGLSIDPTTFQEATDGPQSSHWIEAMHDEMESMHQNDVWDLVELPSGCKPIGCKWGFKTKHDSKFQVERYKAKLVAKGFKQKKGLTIKTLFHLFPPRTLFK